MAKNVLTFSMFNVYKSERSERMIDWFSPARSPASKGGAIREAVVYFFLVFCLGDCVLIFRDLRIQSPKRFLFFSGSRRRIFIYMGFFLWI